MDLADFLKRILSFRIDDKQPLEKCKTIWSKIFKMRAVEWSPFPDHNDQYIRIKRRTYGKKLYTILYGLAVPEDGVQCEF